jgi:two-component system chemotaxis sensor kinase CheA
VWARYPRLIRDLAVACGKQVRLDMDGQSTELDRTVLEAVKDPLTHVLRNAIDHGLESPEERERAGKDPYGHLQLRAYHEGGQVNIEVIDDGRGIDAEKVLARAIERNLVTREKAKSLSEREVLSLIFLPGFSTADRVTSVSGRGVGMDVVKTNIERIGGYVDIQSQKGAGTTIRLKIPLTLAIIPALVVTSRGQKFAIPQVSLLELVRLEATESSQVVEEIHGTPVYRLRGRLLPLVRLHNVLELGGRAADAADAAEGAESYIVVLQADDCSFGLVVDNVHDTEEIVVKPLGPELKALTTYAGATIRGDGRVALILDVLGIASKAGVVASRDKAAQDKARQSERADEDHTSTLLVTTPGGARLAIPLDSVARLDELPRKLVESAGKKRVVQYRSELLPLVFLSEALGEARERSADADGPLQVVVYAYRGRRIGLVVGTIVDIVNEKLAIDRALREPGLLGAAVLQGKVTGVVDIDAIAQRAGVEPALADCAA